MDIGMFGIGAALALGACGSGIGSGIAGMSAIGAWKKAFAKNKAAAFLLITFVGAPMTQTIYGYILMTTLKRAMENAVDSMLIMGVGIWGGLAIGVSAIFQGRAGAAAADAYGETGKGFGNYIMVLGLVETIAIFVMVFMMGIVNA